MVAHLLGGHLLGVDQHGLGFFVPVPAAVRASDFERMGSGGVGTLRFLLYWPYIQPKKGPCTPSSRYDPGSGLPFDDNYCDWSSIDQLVAGAAAHGAARSGGRTGAG